MKKTLVFLCVLLLVASSVFAEQGKKSGKRQCKGYNAATDEIYLDKKGNCTGYWRKDSDGPGGFHYNPDGSLEAKTFPKEWSQ
jgi:hypothetical protein